VQRRRRNLGGGKLVAKERDKLVDRTALHPRRDLLRQEFEEEFAHIRHPRRPARLSQQARARARTRPI